MELPSEDRRCPLRPFLLSVESGEFFHRNTRSFNPKHRVDRELLDNLQNARRRLATAEPHPLEPSVLDALLCRLVFTCYLFDRDIIGPAHMEPLGILGASHLRDVLGHQPRAEGKVRLYQLFKQLREDFNGDLFNDDLDAEATLVADEHVEILDQFFRGTSVQTSQQAFWPYDFGIIPVETISAIYERFLKPVSADSEGDEGDRKRIARGRFTRPASSQNLCLTWATEGASAALLGSCFLDPACVVGDLPCGGLQRPRRRVGEDGTRPRGTTRKSRELMTLLQASIFGVDKNPTARRIAASSACTSPTSTSAPVAGHPGATAEKAGRCPALVAGPASPPGQPRWRKHLVRRLLRGGRPSSR